MRPWTFEPTRTRMLAELPSRPTSTRVVAPSPRCWSSPERCASVTRSWPAVATAASAPCSTSTATRSRRPRLRVRSWCSACLAKRRKRISLEDLNEALAAGKVDNLNLILKGDVSGSVEALEDALLKIDVGDEVDLRIIHRGVGAITQNDVNLATVDSAVIIGFNVKPAERVAELADREGVDLRIYSAIEDIESALKGMLKPEYEEIKLGTAEVREVFKSSKFGNVAGSLIRSGEIKRGTKARIIRDGAVVGEGIEITGLRRFKDDVVEVREGFECGINLGSFNDIRVDDIIETHEMREIPRT